MREAQSACRELVQIGRIDIAAVAAGVGKAHVVGEDDDKIWFARALLANIVEGAAQAAAVLRKVLRSMLVIVGYYRNTIGQSAPSSGGLDT